MPLSTSASLSTADEWILVRCQLGEREAFDELMRQWAAPLYRHARRLLDDAELADDLTQDIWLRVLRGMGGLRDLSNFRSWLFGIAHRAFVDMLRKRYREPPSVSVDDQVDLTAAETIDEDELMRALHTCLSMLAPADREVLTLFHLQGLSLDELATALDAPIGTIKSRLHRARNRLRILMNPEEATP